MKYISTITVILTIFCATRCYSQKYSNEYSLKVKDLKTVEINGKTIWIAKTILTNHSRDTLFYFSYADCEPAFYKTRKIYSKKDIRNDTLIDDGNSVFIDLQKCGAATQTVISVPPSGQRTVDLELTSLKPLTSSVKLIFFLNVYKSKNMYERIPQDDLTHKKDRRLSVKSKIIKIKASAGAA